MKYAEIKPLVIEWAKEKNLTDSGKQYIKVFEEVGELAKAILENDLPEIKDAIGDICITLIIHSYQTSSEIGKISTIEYNETVQTQLFENLTHCIVSYSPNSAINVLNEIAHKYDTTLDNCLLLAWNVIKNRTGKTVDGTFIKDDTESFPDFEQSKPMSFLTSFLKK